jgi:hypothetical protein
LKVVFNSTKGQLKNVCVWPKGQLKAFGCKATKQPSNQATKQPSNQATKQPSNQEVKQQFVGLKATYASKKQTYAYIRTINNSRELF